MKRRDFIKASAALTLGFMSPLRLSAATQRDPRLVVLILRGGMDGLAAVPPIGDPTYKSARGTLALATPGDAGGAIDLNGFFGLHPAFEHVADMYGKGEALTIQAIAPPYMKRSHFDAQDVLETGLTSPTGTSSGWLYRALRGVDDARSFDQVAYAIGTSVPRMLRGDQPVGSWAPDKLPDPDADTFERLMALYDEDVVLGPKLQTAINTDAMMGNTTKHMRTNNLATAAKAAARFLIKPEGPRVAVLESSGWDTHSSQGTASGKLARKFKALDNTLGDFKEQMGSAWKDTCIVVVTEFGRTVEVNGTGGSDHGVGGATMLLGGSIKGGRVIADWPGLSPDQLYKGRDLKPTLDMRSLFAGVLIDHMGVDRHFVDEVVFPNHREKLSGLIKLVS